MSTLVVMAGLALLARPTPAPAPAPAPVSAPAPAPAPAEHSLLSRIQIGAAVGPGFSLSSGSSVLTGGGSPPWVRGLFHGTFDLVRAGPGDLQFLLTLGVQGAGFRYVVQGSVVGVDAMLSARYRAEVIPDLSLFAELGLGFGTFQVTIQQPFLGYAMSSASGFGVRMGGGLEYRILGQLRLLFQPMELTSFSVTSSTMVNGTPVTVTTGASEWSLLLGAVHPL